MNKRKGRGQRNKRQRQVGRGGADPRVLDTSYVPSSCHLSPYSLFSRDQTLFRSMLSLQAAPFLSLLLFTFSLTFFRSLLASPSLSRSILHTLTSFITGS